MDRRDSIKINKLPELMGRLPIVSWKSYHHDSFANQRSFVHCWMATRFCSCVQHRWKNCNCPIGMHCGQIHRAHAALLLAAPRCVWYLPDSEHAATIIIITIQIHLFWMNWTLWFGLFNHINPLFEINPKTMTTKGKQQIWWSIEEICKS